MCPGETAATDAQWGDRAFERQYRNWMGLRWLVCSCVRVHDQQAHLAWRLSRGKCKMHEERRWFAGIDWASQEHVVTLCDGQGKKIGQRKFAHGGTGLAEMVDWLLKASGGEPGEIHVAIETPHGPIVEALLERGFNVYSINPKQLDRFRDRFTVAGAKDDSLDAYVLADSLRTDMPLFRKLTIAEPLIVELREWSRVDENLKVERLRLANRMWDQLWRYYPQMLELADDLGAYWVLELWEAAPTPEKAARVSKKAVSRILKSHRIRRFDAAYVIRELRKPALSVAQGTIEAATSHIRVLVEQLRLVNHQLADAGRQLDRLCKKLAEPVAGNDGESVPGQRQEHRDVTILHSLPGVGRNVLVTMLAEAPDALRRRDYHALRNLCGSAPVTRRSGKSCIVMRRRACNRRLSNAAFNWGRVATQHDPVSKAKYEALRARGHGHARAIRSIVDRLLYVACTMLKNGSPFDPALARKENAAA
jgi:transposase